MSDKFVMDPRVSFVTQILDEIERGIIKIPRFQRELVWKWEQQRDLLCSIFEGIPIGSILVWSTTLENITYYDSIGPFKLQNSGSLEHGTMQMFLMDGLQRMSTLYTILKHPVDSSSSKDLSKFQVYADLESNSVSNMFYRRDEILREGNNPDSYRFLPMSIIFDHKSFLRFQRQIPPESEYLIDRADDVLISFKNYKVPMIPMHSDKQELITKSFERINTRGTVMSETHMLNALSYSPEFQLLTSLKRYKNEFLDDAYDVDSIDQALILQLIKLQLGKSIYNKNTDSLAKEINDTVLIKVFKGLQKTLDFVQTELHGTSIQAFPYKLQAVGVCHALINEPSIDYRMLKAWVIVTAYTGSFGVTARNSETALEDFAKYLKSGSLSWSLNIKPIISIWNDDINFRNSRYKLSAIAQAEKQDFMFGNNLLGKFNEKKGKYVKRPIEFQFESKKSGFFFVTDRKDDEFSLFKLNSTERDSMFLSAEMMDLIKNGKYEEFREKRERAIFNYELSNVFTPAANILNFTDYRVEGN